MIYAAIKIYGEINLICPLTPPIKNTTLANQSIINFNDTHCTHCNQGVQLALHCCNHIFILQPH